MSMCRNGFSVTSAGPYTDGGHSIALPSHARKRMRAFVAEGFTGKEMYADVQGFVSDGGSHHSRERLLLRESAVGSWQSCCFAVYCRSLFATCGNTVGAYVCGYDTKKNSDKEYRKHSDADAGLLLRGRKIGSGFGLESDLNPISCGSRRCISLLSRRRVFL